MPLRYDHGTFTLEGLRLRLPVSRGSTAPWVRSDRQVHYPPEQVRSVTLVAEGGRLFVDVTAEVPVTVCPPGQELDPHRVAGVIHPFAAAGPDGEGLVVSGRSIRAETHLHLRARADRDCATARPIRAGS